MDSPMDSSLAKGGKPRVLIADDERTIADTLRIILHQNGFDAAAVYDGQQAIDTARAWVPDLLLSDIFMPVLGGIDAAIQICARQPACRVVLLSANAEAASLRRNMCQLGFNCEILYKPVPPAELLGRLRTILDL